MYHRAERKTPISKKTINEQDILRLQDNLNKPVQNLLKK